MRAPASALAVVLGVVAVTLNGCGGGGTTTTTTAPTTATPTPKPTTAPPACLCIFDVDRTLTARQGSAASCPNAVTQAGVQDMAYAMGTLILSEVGVGLNKSFCGPCYHGIVSAGSASGKDSKERDVLLKALGGKAKTMTDKWQDGMAQPVSSSLCLVWSDGQKQAAVDSITKWFKSAHQITIPTERVHFFDDRHININPFKSFNEGHGTKYNAHQISCKSRATMEQPAKIGPAIGNCGAQISEIDAAAKDAGSVVTICEDPPSDEVVA